MDENRARLDALDIELSEMFDGLDVFVVGGAVRALFTGNPISDIDLMVTGVDPDNGEMEARGFDLIQNEEDRFPVFLDDNGREVALARLERRLEADEMDETDEENAHRAFEVVSDEDVTVEEDLERRDLTVNAMAVALTDTERFDAGDLVDPFDGRADIDAEMVRMVRPESFAEDPLRILRMARFAARLDFEVEDATLDAARENVDGLHDLPRERWGMEVVKAMKQAQRPSRFFRLLDEADALDVVLPELAALKGVPAGPPEFHQEGDAFEHTMCVLDEMADLRPGDHRAMFAALAHDLGKGLTPEEKLPSHPKHHVRGVDLIPDIRDRLVLSSELAGAERHSGGGVMGTASRFHMRMHNLDDLNESTLLEMVERLRDDYEVSNPEDEPVVTHVTLDELIDLAVADARGREPQGEFDREAARQQFDAALRVLDEVGGAHVQQNFDPQDGEHFGELLLQERIRALRDPEAFGISEAV